MIKNLKIQIRENRFIIIYLVLFILIFFFLIIMNYLVPIGFLFQISPILFIGFAIVIIGFFLFFILNPNNYNQFISFKFLSGNSIKIILLTSMGFSLLISPINFPFTIIAWQEIEFLNYLRSIIFILGSAFLPGSCLLSIIFPDNTLSKRFKIEPFFIELTISPLLSFSLIGIVVIILDFIGFIGQVIYLIVLFLFILILVILDFIIQEKRNPGQIKDSILYKKIKSFPISKNTFIVIIVAIGISILSLGIHAVVHYLITGDSWTALNPAQYIGDPNSNPVVHGKTNNYPIFWCYVSYGLSVLYGIPMINSNAILAPFCFLYVMTLYLIIKSLLHDFKPKYAVLSTIITSIFSNLFFLSPYSDIKAIVSSEIGGISILIFSGQFFFYYKSFALYLAFSSIALFIIANIKEDQNEFYRNRKKEDKKLIFLSAFFLIVSYMSYMLPLIPCLAFIIIFFLFFKKNDNQKHFLFLFLIFLLTLFFLFDLVTNFFNSFLFSSKFDDFLVWILSTEDTNRFIFNYLAYLFFLMIFSFYFIISLPNFIKNKNLNLKRLKKNSLRNKTIRNIKNRFKKLFFNPKSLKSLILICLVVFTAIFFLEIYNLMFKFYIFRFIYIDMNYWFYPISIWLDLLFLSFGIFGILAIYLSYYCFKINPRIFIILFSWILFSVIYASIIHILEVFKELVIIIPPQSIRADLAKYIMFWFTRNWYYAVIPLSIFFTIGFINLGKLVNKSKIILKLNKKLRSVLKFAILSALIFFSYTNIIIAGITWGRTYGEGTVNDREAQIIGYIPIYVPDNSIILTEYKYSLFHGIRTMTSCNYISVGNIFDPNVNYKSYIETIKNNSITYAVLDEKEHFIIDATVGSFLNNFLLKYYFTDTLYQYQSLGIFKYSPIEIEPFRQASIDFMIYADASGPSQWGSKWRDRSIGDSKVQVIPEMDGHLKVLQLTSKSGYAAFRREETNKTRGSVEFWLYTTNSYQNFTYKITKYRKNLMKFLIINNKWAYIDNSGIVNMIPGLTTSPKNNTWHHIRIDFESSNKMYEELERFKWQVIIDGVDKSDQIDFIDKEESGWNFHICQTNNFTDFSVYINAIGFSWDDYYKLGSNMNKSIFEV